MLFMLPKVLADDLDPEGLSTLSTANTLTHKPLLHLVGNEVKRAKANEGKERKLRRRMAECG